MKKTLAEYVKEYVEETEHQGVETASEEQWKVVKAHLADFVLYVQMVEEA